MTKATKRNLIKGLIIGVARVAGVVVSTIAGCAFLTLQEHASTETTPTEYILRAEVVRVDPLEDCVACEDINSEVWEFYEVNDFQLGDFVLLLMDDNATEIIYDDEVLDVRFDPLTY